MSLRCVRCRQRLLYDKSAFALIMTRGSGSPTVEYDVVRTATLKHDSVAMHMNGDPECGKEVSGFRRGLTDSLGVPPEAVMSFLNKL